MIRSALLGDWVSVKELWDRFSTSRLAPRIPASLQDIECYFANALTKSEIAFAVLEVLGEIKGFSIVHDAADLERNKVAFLRAVHIEPSARRYSGEMSEWLNNWAKYRGCTMIQGYCCLDFPLKAYTKLHGVRPLWTVVGKEVV